MVVALYTSANSSHFYFGGKYLFCVNLPGIVEAIDFCYWNVSSLRTLFENCLSCFVSICPSKLVMSFLCVGHSWPLTQLSDLLQVVKLFIPKWGLCLCFLVAVFHTIGFYEIKSRQNCAMLLLLIRAIIAIFYGLSTLKNKGCTCALWLRPVQSLCIAHILTRNSLLPVNYTSTNKGLEICQPLYRSSLCLFLTILFVFAQYGHFPFLSIPSPTSPISLSFPIVQFTRAPT